MRARGCASLFDTHTVTGGYQMRTSCFLASIPRLASCVSLLACLLSYLLAPSNALAQNEQSRFNGLYLGANVGWFFEAWDAGSGSSGAWTVVIGADFNARFIMQVLIILI